MTNGLKLTVKAIWRCVLSFSSGHSYKCDPNTPRTLETAVIFDILGLERYNWYEMIQKFNVCIPFDRRFKSISIKKEVIREKTLRLKFYKV